MLAARINQRTLRKSFVKKIIHKTIKSKKLLNIIPYLPVKKSLVEVFPYKAPYRKQTPNVFFRFHKALNTAPNRLSASPLSLLPLSSFWLRDIKPTPPYLVVLLQEGHLVQPFAVNSKLTIGPIKPNLTQTELRQLNSSTTPLITPYSPLLSAASFSDNFFVFSK
jgi:hypothetical protein